MGISNDLFFPFSSKRYCCRDACACAGPSCKLLRLDTTSGFHQTKAPSPVAFHTILLMVQKSHQLRLVVNPMIYKVFYIPGGDRRISSTVGWSRPPPPFFSMPEMQGRSIQCKSYQMPWASDRDLTDANDASLELQHGWERGDPVDNVNCETVMKNHPFFRRSKGRCLVVPVQNDNTYIYIYIYTYNTPI